MEFETEQAAYTRGYCFELANELARITGWERWTITTPCGGYGHVVVRTPTGDFLDIEGLHDDWTLRSRWEDLHCMDMILAPVPADDDLSDWSPWFYRNPYHTPTIAQRLLDTYNLNLETTQS